MNIKFRPAKASDAQACSRIIQDWGTDTLWMVPLDDPVPMTEFWRSIFVEECGWIACKDSATLGFCARTDDNITGLYVAKEARGNGIGKALLDLAKENRQWITVWAYEKNVDARRFYRREGLVEISREIEVFDDGSSLMDVEHRWMRTD